MHSPANFSDHRSLRSREEKVRGYTHVTTTYALWLLQTTLLTRPPCSLVLIGVRTVCLVGKSWIEGLRDHESEHNDGYEPQEGQWRQV